MSTPTTDLPAFAARHIGPREDDVTAMLEVVGRSSLADLVDTAVPGGIRGDVVLARADVAGRKGWQVGGRGAHGGLLEGRRRRRLPLCHVTGGGRVLQRCLSRVVLCA